MAKTAIPGAQRATSFLVEPDELTIVGVDTDDGREHPLWDPRAELPLDEGLVQDIAEIGQLQDVLVRKNGPLIEVVAGRQRVRAIREINKRRAAKGDEPMRVRVTIRKPIDRRSVDADMMSVKISENENRVDDDYIAKANNAERLLALGKTEAEVARRFGISEQSLRNLLALNELSDGVRAAVQQKKIGFIAAIELRDLTHKDQEETLSAVLSAGNTSASELQRMRRERKKKRNGKSNGEAAAPRAKPVKAKVLRKVADNEEFLSTLDPQARDLLRWVLGDEAAAKRIKGLTALLKEE